MCRDRRKENEREREIESDEQQNTWQNKKKKTNYQERNKIWTMCVTQQRTIVCTFSYRRQQERNGQTSDKNENKQHKRDNKNKNETKNEKKNRRWRRKRRQKKTKPTLWKYSILDVALYYIIGRYIKMKKKKKRTKRIVSFVTLLFSILSSQFSISRSLSNAGSDRIWWHRWTRKTNWIWSRNKHWYILRCFDSHNIIYGFRHFQMHSQLVWPSFSRVRSRMHSKRWFEFFLL